jgi:hypothetical protein
VGGARSAWGGADGRLCRGTCFSQLRRYRAVCTVEMLRATWEKTSNPYLRFATQGDRPKVGIKRRILLPRPKGSSYTCVFSLLESGLFAKRGLFPRSKKTHRCVDLLCRNRPRTFAADGPHLRPSWRRLHLHESRASRGAHSEMDDSHGTTSHLLRLWQGAKLTPLSLQSYAR